MPSVDLGDRVLIMRDGRVISAGPPNQLTTCQALCAPDAVVHADVPEASPAGLARQEPKPLIDESVPLLGSSVFVSDMATFGGEAMGIMRFDMRTGTASRLAGSTTRGYSDLTVGLDGLLYAYGGAFDVDDPGTGMLLRSVSSATFGDIRGIAVDVSGSIYAADWNGNIRRFSAVGELQRVGLQTGTSLTDIDTNIEG